MCPLIPHYGKTQSQGWAWDPRADSQTQEYAQLLLGALVFAACVCLCLNVFPSYRCVAPRMQPCCLPACAQAHSPGPGPCRAAALPGQLLRLRLPWLFKLGRSFLKGPAEGCPGCRARRGAWGGQPGNPDVPGARWAARQHGAGRRSRSGCHRWCQSIAMKRLKRRHLRQRDNRCALQLPEMPRSQVDQCLQESHRDWFVGIRCLMV